jgi:hypothetical protein
MSLPLLLILSFPLPLARPGCALDISSWDGERGKGSCCRSARLGIVANPAQQEVQAAVASANLTVGVAPDGDCDSYAYELHRSSRTWLAEISQQTPTHQVLRKTTPSFQPLDMAGYSNGIRPGRRLFTNYLLHNNYGVITV